MAEENVGEDARRGDKRPEQRAKDVADATDEREDHQLPQYINPKEKTKTKETYKIRAIKRKKI